MDNLEAKNVTESHYLVEIEANDGREATVESPCDKQVKSIP